MPAEAAQLLRAMPFPAALVASDGTMVDLNPAWEAAATPAGLVSTRDEPGRDHLADLTTGKGFAHDAGQAVAAIVRDALVAGEHSTDYVVEDEHGRHDWRAHAHHVELDGHPFALLSHEDRTQAAQAERLGEKLHATSVELNRAQAVAQDRTNLLHGAVQEFHGPITPINLQLHLLQEGGLGELNERQASAVERIQRNVRRWWTLQENLLGNLQGLERSDEMPRRIDLRDLVGEAVPPFSDRSIASGIRLRVEKPDHPLPVEVTPRALVQVMLMLVDHAIKVTSSGGTVWVRARDLGDHCELSIHDQDPSMEPRVAQHLLDRFEVADAEHHQALRSGLLYAHSVVARIGGRLEVACSGPGQGLEVVMSLPQAL